MEYYKRYYINYIEKAKGIKKQIKDIKKIPSECLNCDIQCSRLQKKCITIRYCSLPKTNSSYTLLNFKEIKKIII
jgi:hypothetical protein